MKIYCLTIKLQDDGKDKAPTAKVVGFEVTRKSDIGYVIEVPLPESIGGTHQVTVEEKQIDVGICLEDQIVVWTKEATLEDAKKDAMKMAFQKSQRDLFVANHEVSRLTNLVKALEQNEWGIKVEKIGFCHICIGSIKAGRNMVQCECGKTFHDTCAKKKKQCPNCGRDMMQ